MLKKIQTIARYTKYIYSQKLVIEIIKILKEVRISQKMSHEKLAEIASIHRTAIGHIESGVRKPSLLMFIKIAKALRMDPSELLKKAEERLKDSTIVEPALGC